MAELTGGTGVQRREQVLDSLQVNAISPDGGGWRVRSATAADLLPGQQRWLPLPRDPLLDAVGLRGAHDF